MSGNQAQLREAEATIANYLSEALNLRNGFDFPKPGSPISAYLDAVIDVRQRIDRVEELLVRALRIRGVAARQADHTNAVAQDAFDQAIIEARQTMTDDFVSAKERAAEANLASLDVRRTARAATTFAAQCDEAVDLLKLAHRGLDSVRHDLLTAMRLFHIESALER